MTTYRTGNAIGSTDPRDLYDNAENLDELVNSQDKLSHPDRLGVPRKTWHGMEQDFQSFLRSSGYQDLGDYAPGIEITARNQIIRADGELWRISASVELPYATSGDWAADSGDFVAMGDAVLRQELSSSSGAAMVSTSTGETIQEFIDITNETAVKLQSFNKSTQKTTLIAHRGFRGIAPENTVEAWTIATQLGCTQLECDVNFTSDNVCVVLHDNNLQRTTGYDANIGNTPYSVVEGLDAGSFFSPYFAGAKVPTLRAMLLAVAGKAEKVWVELKGSPTDAQIDIFLSVVEECGFLDIINVQSFDWDVLRRVRLKSKEIEVGPLISTYSPSHVDQVLALAPAVYLISQAALTQNSTIFNAFYDAGISVGTWTVNNLQTLEKCNRNGIKYIMSDFNLF